MLLRPFIQPISAWDVTQTNGSAVVSILGGDAVQTINYEIYLGSSLIDSGSVSVTDNGGDEVRNFNVPLTSSMWLANNNSYTIRVYTSRTDNGVTTNSGYSSVQYFSCYAKPTITIKDSSNTTLGSGYEFTSQSGTLSVSFDAGSASSPALLNDIEINIFGINSGTRDLVYSSGETYTPFVIEFDNLTPTTATNPIYTSYTLEWTAHTVQNMALFGSFSSLTCDYTITENTGLISVENDCANGRIKVSFKAINKFYLLDNSPISDDISSLAIDDTFVYIGSKSGEFAKYNKETGVFSLLSNKVFADVSQNVVWIKSLSVDENHIYIGGSGFGRFVVFDKTTETFGSLISTPFGSTNREGIISCIDTNYVYAGTDNGKFAVYDKSTGTFGALVTNAFTQISSLGCDENNVYVGGYGGRFAIYNKSSQTFGNLIETPIGSTTLRALAVDENNVYVGDASGHFSIYNKTKGIFDTTVTTLFGGTQINSMVVDENYVYIGGNSGRFITYNKSTEQFGSIFQLSGALNINAMTIDNENLYVGESNGKLWYSSTGGIVIRRKETSESEFCTLLSIGRLETPFSISTYSFYDYYAKTNAIYEYQITSGTQVESVQVLSQFGGAYIADGEQAFQIDAEWERGSFSQVQQSAIYEPYGAKYPVVAYNAVTNYRKGTDSCIVFNQPYAYNRSNDYIDRINQTKKQKVVNAFLTNRKAKVIKDFNGDIVLVCVIDVVGNSFVKELGNTLATTQFNWVEVGDFDDDTFRKLGITNSFKLYENQ